jgi:hypothetical protein
MATGPSNPPPFIPGHEGTGYVAALGAGVKHVKEGDRVGVPWLHTACGCCSPCRTGWETLCAEQQNTGYSVNGSFAEYGLADPNFVGHLPAGLDFGPAAPVLCAGVTVYKGLKETEVRPGEWVVISGIGGLGHMAVQYAKAMGMHVVAADIHEDKLALAKLGADLTVDGRTSMPWPKSSASSAVPMARWSRRSRPRRWNRRSVSCVRAAPWRWSDCPGRHQPAGVQHGVEAHHRARLHRRYAPGPGRVAGLCGRGQGGGALYLGQAGQYQCHLCAHGRGQD